jgi:DNA-binding MarR family transcriptional regulator
MDTASATRLQQPSRGNTLPALADQDLVSHWGLVVEGFADTSRVLASELEDALGIPLAWAEVLFRLRRTPGEVMPSTRLAREVSFSSGGFTKLMDRLVEAGFVERRPCPTDRRVVYAALTPRGREVADEALAIHSASLRRHVLDVLGEQRIRVLAETMRLLRHPSREPAPRGIAD